MWGFGGHDDGKSKQIDTLKQAFPTVKELVKNASYEVPITLPNRFLLTLRVNLPTEFPKAPPSIQVLPPIQHRIVDQQMQVMPQAHENLQRWSSNSQLGKTVFEIAQRFIQDPPKVVQQVQNTYANPNPPYPFGTQNNGQAMNPPSYGAPIKTATPAVHHTPQPVVPSNFPELDRMTPAELGQMMNDEIEFNRFFEQLPVVQNMMKIRDDLRNNNEELARKTLTKESEIEKLRGDLQSSAEIIQQQRAAFEVKQQRQQEVMKQFTTPALIERLAIASHEAEMESDAMANRFLGGEMDYKDFIREFMDKRKLFHLRSAKKESLMMIAR